MPIKIDYPLLSRLSALRALWQEAFGDTEEFLDAFFNTAFSPARCRTVTIDGQTAAALYWFDCRYRDSRIAYLYAVATAGASRGQGLCHKLMENTHSLLQTLGYEGSVLVPGNSDLFSFYEAMGYQTGCRIRKFTCTASDAAVALSQITPDAYAGLRRKLLPAGGIVQEKENLDFLATREMFYAGPDFLLAAHREGDRLCCAELLGDTSYAPGILSALGCTEGTFRTPGEDLPFAMYLPFKKGGEHPTYFGLAFD